MSAINNKNTGFIRDERGSIAIIFGLTSIAVFGITAMSIEFGRALQAKERLRMAVDQSAIAGASLPATASNNRVAVAQKNFLANVSDSPLVSVTPTVNATNAGVTVSAAYAHPTVFGGILGVENINMTATATARPQIQNGGYACLIALNPTTSDGLHLQGINKLQSDNCWAWVNSTHGESMNAVGASTGRGQGYCTAGGVVGADHFSPQPYTNCEPMADPFADKVVPAGGNCLFTTRKQYNNGAHVAFPGRYCGGIDIKPQANVVFMPGVYIIEGPFEIQANSTAAGTGVVFVYKGETASMSIKAGSQAFFKAPNADATNVGGLNGFVFFQDQSTTTAGLEAIFQGGANEGGTVKFEGVLYMPTWRVNISGNGSVNALSQYFAAVADSFYMEGNGQLYIHSNASAAGLPQLMPQIKNGPLLLN